MIISPDAGERIVRLLKQEHLDTLDGAFAYEGGEDLHKPGLGSRRRTRVILRDEVGGVVELYLKRYGSPRLVESIRRLIFPWLRTGPARKEFENIRAVRRANVPTMWEIAWAEESSIAGRSCIIVSSVPGDAFERCGDDFLNRGGEIVEKFTERLAELVKNLHGAGLVHRDLYAAHIFLLADEGGMELNLIDLARVFRPRWRMRRWRIKDLAQLKYSMPKTWVDVHWEKFLALYLSDASADTILAWNRSVDRKVSSMRHRAERRMRRTASPSGDAE